MKLVQVYVHGGHDHSEIEECYEVSSAEADIIYNALYEVSLFVDVESGKIVALDGKKISEETVST